MHKGVPMFRTIRGFIVLSAVVVQAGCTTAAVTAIASSSSLLKDQLAVVSAGHTGCMPEQNAIAIIWAKPNGSGLWTATCKDQVYLCSVITTTSGASSYSCAPQVK